MVSHPSMEMYQFIIESSDSEGSVKAVHMSILTAHCCLYDT